MQEKEGQLPEDLGKDISGVDRLKRLHKTFEADLAPLEKQVCYSQMKLGLGHNRGNHKKCFICCQVNSVQEESANLQGSYAGDKQEEIRNTEKEVVDAWNHLNGKVRHRTGLLDDSDDYYKFCIAVNDQLNWMSDMQRQIITYDKSR